MSHAAIWWKQLGSSIRLLDGILNPIRNERSVVLRLPVDLPWEDMFYQQAQEQLSVLHSNRMVRFLDCSGQEPDQQVLEELCSEEVQTNYWPGQKVADYLAGLEHIPFHQMYIWVRGIASPGMLEKWRSFAAQCRSADRTGPCALFILEYRSKSRKESAADEVSYTVTGGDCLVFSLEAAAAYKEMPTEYLAILAQCASGNDPELCGVLLQDPQALFQDPITFTEQVLAQGHTSTGKGFASVPENLIRNRVWMAQINVLFSRLEAWRLQYIQDHRQKLEAWLPMTAENGAKIENPDDLEFGHLYYLTRQVYTRFDCDEVQNIALCRDIRNRLAHNVVVPCEKVQRLLAL